MSHAQLSLERAILGLTMSGFTSQFYWESFALPDCSKTVYLLSHLFLKPDDKFWIFSFLK